MYLFLDKQYKYLLVIIMLFAYILSVGIDSNIAYGQNNGSSFPKNFPQSFGDSMSSREAAPFASFDSIIPKDAPSLEMLQLLMQGESGKLPSNVQDFLMKNEGIEPLPILVSPAQINKERTSYSDETSTLAKVQKTKAPNVPSSQIPLVFKTIVPGMKPIFNPTMNLGLSKPQIMNPVLIAENENNKTDGDKSRDEEKYKKPQIDNKKDIIATSAQKATPKDVLKDIEKAAPKDIEKDVFKDTQKDVSKTVNPKDEEILTEKELKEETLTNMLHRVDFNDLKLRAEGGDIRAQYKLGLKYFENITGEMNPEEGFLWLKKSATAGYVPAMVSIGNFFEKGFLGKVNPKQASFWYKRAANEGSGDGLFYLAQLYDTRKLGHGKAARHLAMGYYRESANMDHPRALYYLGRLYDTDEDSTRDLGQAVKLYRRSAHLGYVEAQLTVGILYETGDFLPQNDALASGWYSKAALQGSVHAQYFLANMYLLGKGVPESLESAIKLYEVAAKKGFVGAQFDLGLLLITEGSAFYDVEKGKYWLQKAADQGDIEALKLVFSVDRDAPLVVSTP